MHARNVMVLSFIVHGLALPNVTLQEQETKIPSKGIDADTIVAYEKLGAMYGGWVKDRFQAGEKNAQAGLPAFRIKTFPKSRLPKVAVPFGLDLSKADFVEADLQELAHLKNLALLDLSSAQVTDTTLRLLREIGLLHALLHAKRKDEARPRSEDDVISFRLNNLFVTAAGLKELAPLKNLASLELYGRQATDEALKDLAPLKNPTSLDLGFTGVTDVGLKNLTPPAKPQAPFSLSDAVTGAGLKELSGLTNLSDCRIALSSAEQGLSIRPA